MQAGAPKDNGSTATYSWDKIECPNVNDFIYQNLKDESKDVTGTELLMPVSGDAEEHLASDLAEAVPQTHGQRPLVERDKGLLFLLFRDTESKTALEFAHTAAANQGVLLLRTNEGKIDQQAADRLQQSCDWDPALIATLQAKAHISLEFHGAGCDVVEALANATEGVVKMSTLPQVAQHFCFAGLEQ
ncbi:hypothetical protein ABBQ38_002143 [Trebouxia sp. C0009 RCD-2024]